MTENGRHVALDGTFNLRDIGGYPAATGVTRWGRLYRSDALHQLSASDRSELARRGVALVIDLRDDNERLAFPSALDGLDARVSHNPVFSSPASSFIAADARLDDLYDDVIENSGARLVSAIRLISQAGDSAVLVHCTAGKDRTGLVVAFALLAAGVEPESVVADYAQTEKHLPVELLDAIVARLRAETVPDAVNLDELVRLSPATALERILDRVEREHSSVLGYLHHHGLTPGELDDLRRVIVDD